MKALLIVPLALAMCLAQEKPTEKKETEKIEVSLVNRIFEIKHADVNRVANIIGLFAAVRVEAPLRIIAVRAHQGEMAAIEDAIRRLDVPPPAAKDIELRAYIVVASPKAQSVGDAMPADLEPVTKQLKSTFNFQSFGILDTLIVRTRDGQSVEAAGASQSLIPDVPNAPPNRFFLTFRSATIQSQGTDRSIWIDNLKFTARISAVASPFIPNSPPQFQNHEVSLFTDVDIREKQKVVVGKTGIGTSADSIILVLTAKIID